MSFITTSQVWAKLDRHVEEISGLRLAELCRDAERVAALVAVHNSRNILIADLSRQHMSMETINILFQLAAARNLRKFIVDLAWGGQNSPSKRIIPKELQAETPRKRVNIDTGGVDQSSHTHGSMHMALRVPRGNGPMLTSEGDDALKLIHREWSRIEKLSTNIRKGKRRGITGSMIRDVIVVGRGVAVEAMKFAYDALSKDEMASTASRAGLSEAPSARIRRNLAGSSHVASRRLHFLSSIDPVAATSLTAALDPTSTFVVSVALQGNEETGLATKALKAWLLYTLGNPNRRPDQILENHMHLITGSDNIAAVLNKPESVYVIPEFVRAEAFTTFTSVALLPLSIVFGWEVVEEIMAGAHDMDVHFISSNPRRNLPILLGLTDIWNDIFIGSSARVTTPFVNCLNGFPAFVGAIESQALGRGRNHNSASLVLDAGGSSVYDSAFFHGDKVVNNEVVSVMDLQLLHNVKGFGTKGLEDANTAQDASVCGLFAHVDSLAFGAEVGGQPAMSPMSFGEPSGVCVGNRPSSVLLAGKLNAFACGQLLALCEHRVAVKAHILEIDPFSPESGLSVRQARTTEMMRELTNLLNADISLQEDETLLHLSTRTILKHYASSAGSNRSATTAATSITN